MAADDGQGMGTRVDASGENGHCLAADLRVARERLCRAQTHVPFPGQRVWLQEALDHIDRIGVFVAPEEWSRFDLPPTMLDKGQDQDFLPAGALDFGTIKPMPALARIGGVFGDWNNRTFGGHDTRAEATRVWRLLDRVARWLYTRPDRPPHSGRDRT